MRASPRPGAAGGVSEEGWRGSQWRLAPSGTTPRRAARDQKPPTRLGFSMALRRGAPSDHGCALPVAIRLPACSPTRRGTGESPFLPACAFRATVPCSGQKLRNASRSAAPSPPPAPRSAALHPLIKMDACTRATRRFSASSPLPRVVGRSCRSLSAAIGAAPLSNNVTSTASCRPHVSTGHGTDAMPSEALPLGVDEVLVLLLLAVKPPLQPHRRCYASRGSACGV